MSAERWQRVKELFGGALDLPPEDREAWLAAAGDPAVADQVRALLAAHDDSDDRLERGVAAVAPGVLEDLQTAVAGRRIGPYRILSELGRGGMGAVYLAVRDEPGFEQKVAIKLIKRGMDTDGIVRRFLHERRILAGLLHPHIARLYDGGSTPDGRPYFVMEHVEGRPVTTYAREEGLGIEARLRLFLKVCSAVQSAHQRLIVHRDLKPANILVGADGEPKLLDFGIAKLLDPAEGELTELGEARPNTPEYASPEQLAGGAITTATDVYGLGLLLYELLAGRRPDGQQLPSQAAAASGHSWGRRLRGDLDTIAGKALALESAERYGSAAALAEDVERHLRQEPVLARRPTFAYRLGRMVRRHKLASAFVLSLAAFAGTAAWQAYQIEQQRQRAAALSEFLQGLFRGADPEQVRGHAVTVRELLDAGARRLLASDTRPQWRVEWRADLLRAVGEVYANLGLYAEAEKFLGQALSLQAPGSERAALLTLLGHVSYQKGDNPGARRYYEQAAALKRRFLGAAALPLAEDLNGLGLITAEEGDLDGAAVRFAEAVALARRAGPEGRKLLADGLNNQGWLTRRQGDLAGAQSRFEESLALSRQVLGDDHPETVRVRSNLASVLFLRGDGARAEALYREILALRRRLLGDHPDVARTLNSLGTVQEKQGRLAAARASFGEALALGRRLQPPAVRMELVSLNGLAAVARRQGDLPAAARFYEEGWNLGRHHLAEDPREPANALLGWALVRRDRGEPAAAARDLRQGLALLAGTSGAEAQIAQARELLGELEP